MTMRMTIMAALLLSGVAAPVSAQRAPTDVNKRVDKLESQMRAVQRKVFPGGNQQFFEAEIPPPAAAAPPASAGATAPIIDLTARVGSLEQALARLTGEVEANSFKLRQLEQTVARLTASPDATAPAAATPSVVPFGEAAAPPSAPPPAPAPPPPSTGDAGEDLYLSGYRLWVAKDYAGAEKILQQVVAKYPNHRRASFAQNLYGRSLLDDGQPAKAAEAFYANYQKMPRGERAPDSLYFLGQALMALKPSKPADACKVYGELLDVYGEKINADLKAKVDKGKRDAKCGA